MSNEKPVELTEAEQVSIWGAYASGPIPMLDAVTAIVAAREAASRREALLEAAEELVPEDLRRHGANCDAEMERLRAKVARAIEWARVEAGELGAEDLRAALAEPERDEESGR